MKSKFLLLVTMLIGALYVVSCGTKHAVTDYTQKFNTCAAGGHIELNDRYTLDYYLNLRFENNDMEVMWKNAEVIDKQNKDTTKVEMKNLKCVLISDSPVIYASVFNFNHLDQRYIVHVLFDYRTILNKKTQEVKATEKCYNVADLDPKRIEQYLGK